MNTSLFAETEKWKELVLLLKSAAAGSKGVEFFLSLFYFSSFPSSLFFLLKIEEGLNGGLHCFWRSRAPLDPSIDPPLLAVLSAWPPAMSWSVVVILS